MSCCNRRFSRCLLTVGGQGDAAQARRSLLELVRGRDGQCRRHLLLYLMPLALLLRVLWESQKLSGHTASCRLFTNAGGPVGELDEAEGCESGRGWIDAQDISQSCRRWGGRGREWGGWAGTEGEAEPTGWAQPQKYIRSK